MDISDSESSDNSSDGSFDSETEHDSYVQPKYATEKKKKKEQIISPELSAALDRTNVSNRNATYIIAATSFSLGKELATITLNRESIRLRRKQHREEAANNIKDQFTVSTPLTVHWDGKLLTDLSGNDKVERTAILVSGIEIEKLIGVPKSTNSTGETQASVVFEALKDWKLLDKISSMCFDTTASNTGVRSGACVLLEKKMNRKLLNLACRHHVLELIVSRVHDSIFEVSTGPNIKLFNDFRNGWSTLNKENYVSGIEDLCISNTLLKHKSAIVAFVRDQLKMPQQRGDYKEMLCLVLVFLGENPSDKYCILAPGAFHRARWMAKIIYCLKIYLFRFERDVEEDTLATLRDFNLFIVLIYIKYWYISPSGVEAPKNDLQLIKDIISYREINDTIANAALASFKNHLWYVSELLVGFSFFDSHINDEVKKEMVVNLSKKGSKKPLNRINFVEKNIIKNNIQDFVTSTTLNFFTILKLKTDFLKINPMFWKENIDYLEAEQVVKNLKVRKL